MIWNFECGRYGRSSHLPLPGCETKVTEIREKEFKMNVKLNDKNLKFLADQNASGNVDQEFGMAIPCMQIKAADSKIKQEFPSSKDLDKDILSAKIAYLVFVHLTSIICEMHQLIMLLDTCAKQCFQSVPNRFSKVWIA